MKPVSLLLSLSLTLLVAVPSPAAPSKAYDKTNVAARKLLERFKKRKVEALATPLLDFTLSPPNPTQNQNVNVFITPNASFGGRRISLDAKLNGQEISLETPTTNFWNLPLGLVTESRSHTLEVTKYIENLQDNTDLRTAISQLDSQINSLTNQINVERDAAKRKILQESRAEKVALKTELIEQLKKLRTKVGSQTYTFKINPALNAPGFPSISTISPISGDVNGGTVVTINGANFTSPFTATLGGLPVSASTLVNATTIQITTPDFGASEGIKDLELRFSSSQGVKNVILANAFYAREIPPTPNMKPVAVAGGSQQVNSGATVTLDGRESYDHLDQPLDYIWTLVAAPANSSHPIGETLPNSVEPTFTPDVFGTFVVRLVVKQNNTAEMYESDPSLAVIIANGAPQPTIAPIRVMEGYTVTEQVFANNPNYGHSSSYEITTAPQHGTASVNGSGLVSFTAGTNYVGSDSFVVTVTDQAGLSGTVTGNVTIIEDPTIINDPPMPTADSITVSKNMTGNTQVFANDPNAGDVIKFSVAREPAHGSVNLNAVNGHLTYTPETNYSGPDSVRVVVIDDKGAFAYVEVTITVLDNSPPVIGNLLSVITSRGEPFGVLLFVDSVVTDTDGTITEMRWDFGDGTSERANDAIASKFHNYIAAGSYTATLTVKDDQNAVSTKSFTVSVVDTDIPVLRFTGDAFSSSTAPLTVNFDASGSSDSDGIVEYRWNWTNSTTDQDEVTTSPTISHTFGQGLHEIRVVVLDEHGAAALTVFYVAVDHPAALPAHPALADFQVAPSRRVVLNNAFTFDGTRSFNPNIGGTVTDYIWNFDDHDVCPGGCTTTGATPSYTYLNTGTYYAGLMVAGPDGIFLPGVEQEVQVVNAGFSPRSLPHANVVYGTAPLTVDFVSESFDQDGTITQHLWGFGADPNCGATDCSPIGQNVTYTFENDGEYIIGLTVTDNDGNSHTNYVQVNVDPAFTKLNKSTKKTSTASHDPRRDQKRQTLLSLCARGRGDSCYHLSKMYEEDGNTSLAAKLKTKACNLGHQEACSAKTK